MKFDKKTMLLYAVTDRTLLGGRSLYTSVEAAINGGATCIQLREKELNDDEFLSDAVELAALCKRYAIPLFINDNVDIAVKCSADGIHIGQNDMDLAEARRIVGDKMIIGVSVHTIEEAITAAANGADYLGVGAIFPTSTKSDADVLSIDILRGICASVQIPVVAIGGINKGNLAQLSGTGIDGVALVSAIFAADNIESECRVLRNMAEQAVNGI